jgi:hypothetical protein
VAWIHLASDENQWKALVNTGIRLGILFKTRNVLTSRETASFSSGIVYVANYTFLQKNG